MASSALALRPQHLRLLTPLLSTRAQVWKEPASLNHENGRSEHLRLTGENERIQNSWSGCPFSWLTLQGALSWFARVLRSTPQLPWQCTRFAIYRFCALDADCASSLQVSMQQILGQNAPCIFLETKLGLSYLTFISGARPWI